MMYLPRTVEMWDPGSTSQHTGPESDEIAGEVGDEHFHDFVRL